MASFTFGSLSYGYMGYHHCTNCNLHTHFQEVVSRTSHNCVFSIVLLQFFLAVEAATIHLLDKSLLQAASTATSSSEATNSPGGGGGQQRSDNYAPRPQVMVVGPVGVEVASTRHAVSTPGDGNSALGASHGFPPTPTSPMPRSRVSRLAIIA